MAQESFCLSPSFLGGGWKFVSCFNPVWEACKHTLYWGIPNAILIDYLSWIKSNSKHYDCASIARGVVSRQGLRSSDLEERI